MLYDYQQLDAMDCGPTCLRMVAKHYGRNLSAQELREAAEIGKDGVNMLGIAQAAERVGFKSLGVKVNLEKLKKEAPLPCIVHWGQNHFVVVVSTSLNHRLWGRSLSVVEVADPAKGLIKYTEKEFESQWATTVIDGECTGVALLLEPTAAFYENDTFAEKNKEKSFGVLFQYFFKYKSLIVQLGLGLLVGSMIQLIMPFLTQSVVDTGIQTRNLNFIYLVLAAQLMLFIGRMAVDFLRSWILLHVSTRINLSILSEFLSKLLKLPVSYFESKQTGDILQRIGDHSRIESFLTGTSLNVLLKAHDFPHNYL